MLSEEMLWDGAHFAHIAAYREHQRMTLKRGENRRVREILRLRLPA